MEMVLSNRFEQLSLNEQDSINGGRIEGLYEGDLNKAAAAAAVSAAVCPEFAAPLLIISAGCWLADACLPSSAYDKRHSSGGGKF